jgi:hypothetical protein
MKLVVVQLGYVFMNVGLKVGWKNRNNES